MSLRKHGVLPDTQAKPGVPLQHMAWAGDYFAEKKPDVIIHVGDHWDMASLSSYDKGTMAAEGRHYWDDIQAGNQAMDLFMAPIRREQKRMLRALTGKKWKSWTVRSRHYIDRCLEVGRVLPNVPTELVPYLWAVRLVFCIGNHEQRIMRHVNSNPELHGTLGYHDFNLEEHGWEVHDFLKPVVIDGVSYQHYVPHPNTGKPWGGAAERRLTAIGFSHTAGHEQGKKSAERYLQDGKTVHRNLIVGSYYLHDEEYKGKMGNHHWRGIILKHEVAGGSYDLMEVSMSYLSRRYYAKYPDAPRRVRYVKP